MPNRLLASDPRAAGGSELTNGGRQPRRHGLRRWLAVWVATALVWAMLLAAPRSVVELQVQRRRGQGRGSDVDQLARLTRVPAALWVGVFFVLGLAALVGGGWLLLAP